MEPASKNGGGRMQVEAVSKNGGEGGLANGPLGTLLTRNYVPCNQTLLSILTGTREERQRQKKIQ